jgi:ketosteroid isomerase-like protein
MLASHARLILHDVYASWQGGDLDTVLSYFTPDLAFIVHSSPDAPSFVGSGVGREAFGSRLERFQRLFKVESFQLKLLRAEGISLLSTVGFHYRHRASGLDVDGHMRHKWLFVGDEIGAFEVFHDARRMRAFYDLALGQLCPR